MDFSFAIVRFEAKHQQIRGSIKRLLNIELQFLFFPSLQILVPLLLSDVLSGPVTFPLLFAEEEGYFDAKVYH